MPALLGQKQPRHDYLYWEFHGGGFQQAVRMGRWKAVRLELGQPIQFYDLEADPGETTNVSGAHPDLVQRAAELFEGARTGVAVFPAPRGTRWIEEVNSGLQHANLFPSTPFFWIFS